MKNLLDSRPSITISITIYHDLFRTLGILKFIEPILLTRPANPTRK